MLSSFFFKWLPLGRLLLPMKNRSWRFIPIIDFKCYWSFISEASIAKPIILAIAEWLAIFLVFHPFLKRKLSIQNLLLRLICLQCVRFAAIASLCSFIPLRSHFYSSKHSIVGQIRSAQYAQQVCHILVWQQFDRVLLQSDRI